MKKIGLFSIVMITISFLMSCEKKKIDEFDLSQQELIEVGAMAIIENLDSYPASEASVVPVQIPGENRGGNRTCEEVAAAFSTDELPIIFMCELSEKIDFNDGSFAGEFPEELNVTTDGTFVSFEMEECIEIDGSFYKVGAVIVKGSNQANVYFYPNGTMGDSELAAPFNSSGGPAGLSNLTFCFVECDDEQPDLVIAVKVFDLPGYWASTTNGNYIEYYDFIPSTSQIYFQASLVYPWAGLKISDLGNDKFEIELDNSLYNTDFLFQKIYIFVGDKADFTTDYKIWPYINILSTPVSTITIHYPFL